MKFPLVLCLLCLWGQAFGQLISQPRGETLERRYKFNPETVAARGISKITVKEEVKRDGEPIQAPTRWTTYTFGPEGRPQSIAHISGAQGDTLHTSFTYEGKTLRCEFHDEAVGRYSYCYTYNTEGVPTARQYRRYRTMGDGVKGRMPRVGDETTRETFVHLRYPGQVHTTVLNGSGRPFEEEKRYYANGKLTRYISNYTMSSGGVDETYTYDPQGRMTSKTHLDDRGETKTIYSYDAQDRPATEERYVNGERQWRKEYVYHSASGNLTAELVREDGESRIRILTYGYEY